MRLMLLGPQRHEPVVREALDHLGVAGKIAMITAGWQEREDQDEELREELGVEAVNLRVYARARRVFDLSPSLFEHHRKKQDALKRMQRLYGVRLDAAMTSVARLDEMPADEWGMHEAEREDALEQVRVLDRRHTRQVRELWGRFIEEHRPSQDPVVARHREEMREALEGCEAVAIAGGHVAILLNRMLLFEFDELLEGRTIVAWSAGAMLLSSRIALFHDRAAQGPNHAEVLGPGLGLFDGLLPMPAAERRIRTQDLARTSLLAGRFAPDVCAPLEKGMWIERCEDGTWRGRGARRFDAQGRLSPWPEDEAGGLS